jgi:hypothetical protein
MHFVYDPHDGAIAPADDPYDVSALFRDQLHESEGPVALSEHVVEIDVDMLGLRLGFNRNIKLNLFNLPISHFTSCMSSLLPTPPPEESLMSRKMVA